MDIFQAKPGEKRVQTKRRGRGTGSGLGKTGGRGMNGSGQRKGKKTPYHGFRGGDLPFFRRIPKRGFTSPVHKEYQIVNLNDIENRFQAGEEVNPQTLKKVNLIKDENKSVKVLAKTSAKFKLKANIKVDRYSKKTQEIIESLGGTIECLKR